MVSHPELGSDPPIGSDRESGCDNASVTCDVSMVHSMRLLKFHLYIYGDEPPKFMKLPMDSSSVTRSFFLLL